MATPASGPLVALRPPASGRRRSLRWEELYAEQTLDGAVARLLGDYDVAVHPYFRWIADAATDLASFRQTQVAFRFAVEGFGQALAAVVARIPRLELRVQIAENVAEEHGCFGRHSHKETFAEYLAALGATEAELAVGCPVEVRAFAQSVTNFCMVNSFEAGAAHVGIIERIYVDISARLVDTVRRRAWADMTQQSHYAVHEELDVEHARELLAVAEPGWAEPRQRAQIALGLLLGAHYFWRLYDDLLPG
jgi:pyrroloquinoline-quinone synthase